MPPQTIPRRRPCYRRWSGDSRYPLQGGCVQRTGLWHEGRSMKNSFLNRLQARKYPGLLLTLISTLVVQTVGTYVQHPAVLKDVFFGAPASSTAPISPHDVLLPQIFLHDPAFGHIFRPLSASVFGRPRANALFEAYSLCYGLQHQTTQCNA